MPSAETAVVAGAICESGCVEAIKCTVRGDQKVPETLSVNNGPTS